MYTTLKNEAYEQQVNGFKAAIKAIDNVDHTVDTSYIIANNALPTYYNMYSPQENNIVWWIKNNNGNYTVYTFKTSEFISGFITAAEQLNVDFRDYVLAAPYGITDGKIINYNIEGYDLLPYNRKVRVSAPIGPFYTGSIEDDAYNVNWE